MNSIGFNNFRRFATFPEMDLGDITLLVGGNNSGKSTLVKALLLCVDNVRLMTAGTKSNVFSAISPKFRFDANEWHDVKIKTFSRAIHNRPAPSLNLIDDDLSLPTEMRFTFTLGGFKFIIEVKGDRDKDEVTGEVSFISIEDRENMVQYTVSYDTHSMSYSVLGSTTERETLVKRLYKDYVAAKKMLEALSEAGDDIAAISAQSEKVASLEKRIEEFVVPEGNELPEDFDYEQALQTKAREFLKTRYTATTWDLNLQDFGDIINENLFLHAINNFIGFAKHPGEAQPTGIKDPEEAGLRMQAWLYNENARVALKQEIDKMEKSHDDLALLLNSISIEYITAHAANQNTIYNTADRNDYIAQTVHEFVRAKILRGHKEYLFVTKWMKDFGVGDDFDVVSMDGEAYRVKIHDEDGSTVNLADKGMGSIQVMILLLRLATILRVYEPQNIVAFEPIDELRFPTIIIEEPEQNLHPRVQSFLADLLLYLNKEYHCKFIIETHSEYLIRKTQVLVANEDYEDEKALTENIPFKVYFFEPDSTKRPRSMEFEITGGFKEKFGPGFFDEATKSDMTIIRKEMEQKKKNRK